MHARTDDAARSYVRPGGMLVLSGILAEQVCASRWLLAAAGLGQQRQPSRGACVHVLCK